MRMYALGVIGVLIFAAVGGWATFGLGKAHSTTPAITQVDTLQVMSTTKDLPSPRYDLY